MKVGNIVSSSKTIAPDDFNIVKKCDEIIIGLPTMIIGYDYVSKNYPDFDITDIYLEPNMYWTFKRTEKRDKYEEDLAWFINKVYRDLTKDITYIFVDPIHHRNKTLFKIIRKIYATPQIISFLYKEMLYVYGDKFIFGFDLSLLKYVDADISRIIGKIREISSVFLDNEDILLEYDKNLDALDRQIKYIPYLYSLRNQK